MIWRMAGFFFLLPVLAWGQAEPDPETYIPPFVEIREHAPAGVTDEWWMRAAKELIWHVTPAYNAMPDVDNHEPYEVIRSATAGYWIHSSTSTWEKFPDFLISQEMKDYLYAGDDDTVWLYSDLNYVDDPLYVMTSVAHPPYQVGANNYNILNNGLNADQLDNYELFDIPYYVFQRMTAGANVWLASDPISATMVIGVTFEVPTPAVIHAGTGIAVRTPTPGGTPGWIVDQVPPTPQPTLHMIGGANIQFTTIAGGYIASVTTAGASTYLQVIGGGIGIYTLTHNFGYQYPSIACYTLDATAQLLHLVDTYCPNINYATVAFSYIPSASSILAVVSAGSGVGSGSMVINVTQEASAPPATPTPLPTMSIAVNGNGSFTGVGVNSGTLNIFTPVPTFTYTPAPSPTPPKINAEIGGVDDLEFALYTLDGPSLVQGVIGETSAVVDVAYRNDSDNELTVLLDEAWEYNALHVVAARADSSIPFGDTGEATFAINPGLNRATLCQFTDYGTDRRVFDPADIRFVTNSETQIHFNYSPGAMVANFLIVSGTALVGNGAANSFLINHGLGHSELIVQVYEAGGDHQKMNWCDLVHSSTNAITLTFPFVPTSNQYLVMWADARQIVQAGDEQWVRLDGSNRMKARGDQFNDDVRVWADSIRNRQGLTIRVNQDGTSNEPLYLSDKNKWYASLGESINNLWNIAAGRYYLRSIAGTWIEKIDSNGESINGALSVVQDVTASMFWGDTVDVGWGLSKSQSGYGRITIASWTPTPTPVPSAPTPTPTERYLPLAGGVMNSSAVVDANEGNYEGAHVVETTILRYRAITVATEAELLALLQTNGSTGFWLPGGSPLASASVQYKKAADTGNWFMHVTYSTGEKASQKLTKYSERIPGATYLVAARLDDQIYLVRQW